MLQRASAGSESSGRLNVEDGIDDRKTCNEELYEEFLELTPLT